MEYIREMKNSGESRQLVETAFKEKAVWVTVTTKEDKRQAISYHCPTVRRAVEGQKIVWLAKALAFKKKFGADDKLEDKLNEAMALAFMHWLKNGV